MDKKLSVQLNGSRKVIGTLRGYDVCMGPLFREESHGCVTVLQLLVWILLLAASCTNHQVFLNVTLADALEEQADGEKLSIGTIVVRGNSIVSLEALEKI
ncbi:uncharacterized protein CANTADRAFT_27154 [Suhomyces tanzawaensis NRRL Y-17324]|uniref:Sm protein G n=1 Tax=Suhomyces tanzawaensis NRRL Y-17324 TaxID=984487 RepID=A0A1E4SCK5_9ASCO|nr:uncharacterized protein CANTADRAFT_27154 [Suhomyces tanzawaensis NRRL Y-17324]ODV77257.1 hypothetical protein CANTADRAFT_27154 [Suhomyces tanzawaensis NRRL Y-17324]